MDCVVLIVDDSPAMRAFVRRVLELSGVEAGHCLEASNGEEALKVLETSWVDAVLTDINMPLMDGEELLLRMSENSLWCSIPVLVVSADGTESRIRRMLMLGARGYVTKPFAPETLRGELENSLGVACGCG
jgi:two-component system chemotaxis response regulator CheY